MTATSGAEMRGIISVNRVEQQPRALPPALVGHDIARFTGRPAKANPRGTTTGPEIARFTGGPVVVAPPDEPVVVEDPEPEMVVPADETAIERLKSVAKSPEHLRDHKPKNPYCDACQQSKMFHRPHCRLKHHGPLPTKFGERL